MAFTDRAILFTNLSLLGLFECSSIPTAYQNVILEPTMFNGPAPNTKGLEVVLWFLFTQLDANTTRQKFVQCWPAFDRKQSRELIAVAFHWLDQLKKDGHLWPTVAIRKSYLEDGQGERLERILCAFSSYVLEQVTRRNHPKSINDIDQVMPETLSREMEDFIKEAQFRRQVNDQLLNAAHQVEKELMELQEKSIQLKDRKRKLVISDPSELQSTNSLEQQQRQQDQLDTLRSRWRIFDQWSLAQMEHYDTLKTALVDKKRHRLDGDNLRVDTPNEALRVWRTLCQPTELRTLTDPQQSVDIMTLTKLWHASYVGAQAPPNPLTNKLLDTCQRAMQLTEHHQDNQSRLDTMKTSLQERIQMLEQAFNEDPTSDSSTRSTTRISLFPTSSNQMKYAQLNKDNESISPALTAMHVHLIDDPHSQHM
ncbi:HAUS augmin-like complex subunit 6 N-terminus-domain-containing protein [Syncephalis plumigaleata]|nr:HAUS augmin-like complex subunit 6 N-terminus-domain-containing protein [Syncephalis plumigaleata]